MDNQGVKEIAALARASDDVVIVNVSEGSVRGDPIPFVARPTGGGAVAFEGLKAELDKWRTAPERRDGTAKAATLQAFIDLTIRHQDVDSALFADLNEKAPNLVAVIDYHTIKHEPRFRKHRIAYQFPLSPEWLAWKKTDCARMDQAEWAEFVEERIADFSAPTDGECSEFERLFQTKIATPAELLTLSRGMQVNVKSRVKNARVLQSGETEIIFDEVHADATGRKLIVPGLFVIRIPLFVDSDPERLTARLRYRVTDGNISWFYQLYRTDLVIRARLAAEFNRAITETGLPGFEGSPE